MIVDPERQAVEKLFDSLEPHLGGDARRGVNRLRSLLQALPDRKLGDLEKDVKKLLAQANKNPAALAEEVRAAIAERDPVQMQELAARVGKLSAVDLNAFAKGFDLELPKGKAAGEVMRDFLVSFGQKRPKTKSDLERETVTAHAARLRKYMDAAHAGGDLETHLDAAYRELSVQGFEMLGRELGYTLTGAKTKMRKQLRELAENAALMSVRTNF